MAYQQQSGVRTFVVIPGAGGSAWIWSRVTPFLVGAGHEAIASICPATTKPLDCPATPNWWSTRSVHAPM